MEAARQDRMEDVKEEDDVDIDLTDPDVDKAATKIQSAFKGRQARLKVEAMKKTTIDNAVEEVEAGAK